MNHQLLKLSGTSHDLPTYPQAEIQPAILLANLGFNSWSFARHSISGGVALMTTRDPIKGYDFPDEHGQFPLRYGPRLYPSPALVEGQVIVDKSKLREALKELFFRLTEQENNHGMEDWVATRVASEFIEDLLAASAPSSPPDQPKHNNGEKK